VWTARFSHEELYDVYLADPAHSSVPPEEWLKHHGLGPQGPPASSTQPATTEEEVAPLESVISFYYAWYATLAVDGEWQHWNHPFMPHWREEVARRYPKYQHAPPEDIGSTYYPQLGPYSSRDPEVLRRHMQMARQARIGVFCVSWWGRHGDSHGVPTDMPPIMAAAAEHGIKIIFHIEPYEGRTAASVAQDVVAITKQWGTHPAFYRDHTRGNRPFFFVYDSYQILPSEWAKSLLEGKVSMRGGGDSVMIGLWAEEQHGRELHAAGFDGAYNYFAANTFSHGSRWENWRQMQNWAEDYGMFFIPSVGPGYDDLKVRPWNAENMKQRRAGGYYNDAWRSAMSAIATTHSSSLRAYVSVTSFNEWHEGTQIEAAVPKEFFYPLKKAKDCYLNYDDASQDFSGEASSTFYLNKTREWANILEKSTLENPHGLSKEK